MGYMTVFYKNNPTGATHQYYKLKLKFCRAASTRLLVFLRTFSVIERWCPINCWEARVFHKSVEKTEAQTTCSDRQHILLAKIQTMHLMAPFSVQECSSSEKRWKWT
jgi:hypothetical protein